MVKVISCYRVYLKKLQRKEIIHNSVKSTLLRFGYIWPLGKNNCVCVVLHSYS